MKNNILLGLVSAGLLFSGYLSGTKLLTDTCAFKEGCPYFLGYPACYFGFIMYLTMFALVLLAQKSAITQHAMLRGVLVVSALGILFAGYFTLGELPKLSSEGLSAYLLGLPTCAYGLIVYLAIFVAAGMGLWGDEKKNLGERERAQ
jgi:hypothetical protein